MKIIITILLVVLLACNNISENNDTISADTKNDTVGYKNDAKNDKAPLESVRKESETKDSTILISFPKDSTWVAVAGKMRGINHPVTVYIPVKRGKLLTATLTSPDASANIRINQIFTPSGKADGPFGKELKQTLREQGTYKLILAENMMQGEEWKGKFNLTVRVE